ncbi:F0F1 ATP synthase subunit A [Streptococcus orisasini]|uniref:F0F1 ATP synthase subunit A n=1 Tax=Streptococcus orisasini TaxID=1080071 RepID=UPI00070BD8BE|nr:F0F1 ATP synthase subunit A [Streptococcus orisasini]
MESNTPTISFGPVTFDLTLLAMSLLIVLVVFGFVFWASRHMTLKPKGKQNVLEYLYDFVTGIAKENLGEENGKRYSLFLFTLFTFIAFANNLGLMSRIETSKYNLWTSPTSNMMYDFGLALFVTIIIHVEGIRRRGLKSYLKAFITPIGMTPMNLLEEVTNLASLALRLYGNIYAGEVVTGLILRLADFSLFASPVALALNLMWTAFSVFISCLQGYVFTLLTSIYLSKKVNGE